MGMFATRFGNITGNGLVAEVRGLPADYARRMPGTITAPQQTVRSRVTNLAERALRPFVSEATAARTARKITDTAADWTPLGAVTGTQEGAQDAAGAYNRGDWVGTALGGTGAALSMLPLPGFVGKAGRAALHEGERLLANEAKQGIRAYHGSPHDFDKFSLSKIGTGEGAQAYGHGLYFAENEGVAKQYRDQLAADGFVTGKGKVFDPYRELQHPNIRAPLARTGDLHASLARAKELLPTANAMTRPMLEADLARLEQLQGMGGIRPNNGHMYEVNINAHPDDFLDWDAPKWNQPQPVKDLLREIGDTHHLTRPDPKVRQTPSGKWTALNVWDEPIGSFASQDAAAAKSLAAHESGQQMGGMSAYNRLGGNSIYSNIDEGAGSARLQAAGIPGIKYLDQGSRDTGNGSRNFVVFNDALVSIMRKYGIVPPIAGAAAYGATQPQGKPGA